MTSGVRPESSSAQTFPYLGMPTSHPSVDGAFVLMSDLYPVGTVLRLKLNFVGNREISSTVRVRSRLPGRGNGVAFRSLAPEHRNSIEVLVQRGHPDTASPLSGIRSVYSY